MYSSIETEEAESSNDFAATDMDEQSLENEAESVAKEMSILLQQSE